MKSLPHVNEGNSGLPSGCGMTSISGMEEVRRSGSLDRLCQEMHVWNIWSLELEGEAEKPEATALWGEVNCFSTNPVTLLWKVSDPSCQ